MAVASSHAEEFISTGVRLPAEALALLRRAAVERAEREGGRVSVSAVVADLVRDHAGALAGKARS
ncbi:hypothetical protein E2C06_30620 [Dankookia rubra]|uniref:Uncharacterized protein n=1 Tax=Dankookia rubra TaxID=1442381 RepID=A0A4R5Q7F4_9PROT|nr:hypothetical protein [Dankookia rubra]TDH58824.1 hypothetical protein E2C06_30620 [Dankookia rubra]